MKRRFLFAVRAALFYTACHHNSMLEPDVGKLASPVLRGRGGGNIGPATEPNLEDGGGFRKRFGIDFTRTTRPLWHRLFWILRQLVQMFVNLQLKLIPTSPRKVVRSRKIQHKIEDESYDEEIKNAVSQIEDKLRNGEDINLHLTMTIKCGDFTDWLLGEWNIYHLHLSLEPDPRERELVKGKTFTKRTRDVLFLMISADTVYLIDIRPHGRHGERHVFAQKEILNIVTHNWPEVLEPLRMKGVTGIEFETDDSKQIEEFRKLGIDIPYRINDSFYSSPGGLTMDSRSVNVMIETDCLYEMAERAMKYVSESRLKIDKELSVNENYGPAKASFRLQFCNGAFLIYEESTMKQL